MSRDPDCVFCAVIAGETEAEVVYSDDACVAFLDHRPLFPGHVLLVPRGHHVTIEDLPVTQVGPLFSIARRLAGAVRDAMDAQGTFVAMNNVVSQSVPHLHVHIVPRRRKDGLRGFFWPRHKYGEGEMATSAEAIRKSVAQRAS